MSQFEKVNFHEDSRFCGPLLAQELQWHRPSLQPLQTTAAYLSKKLPPKRILLGREKTYWEASRGGLQQIACVQNEQCEKGLQNLQRI